MGLLNTFFVAANDREAKDRAEPVGPDSGLHTSGTTDIDTLLSILTGVGYESIAAEPPRYLVEPEEQWLQEVRPALVQALARLDPTAVLDVARAWVVTDELVGTRPEDAAELIRSLRDIAVQATSTGDALYFWGSV